MFQIAGFTFHLYGLLIGLSIGLGWWLVMKKAQQRHFSVSELEKIGLWAVLGGIAGARLYHVVTDWVLYQENWLDAFKIWQGGLSIIGAVVGGLMAAALAIRLTKTKLKLTQLLDLAVFGLPFAQALGRWGNFINQELYGLPTTWPWGLPIEAAHRLPGFETYDRFHPLFAYEMILMLGFGLWLWWAERKQLSQIGRGEYFRWYTLYYAVIRFGLDFLRLDKTLLGSTGLGVNQAVLGLVIVGLLLWEIVKRVAFTRLIKIALVGGGTALVAGIFLLTSSPSSPVTTSTSSTSVTSSQLQDYWLPAFDHQQVEMNLGDQTITVEIVNTPASITQGLSGREKIGADGLLFLLPPGLGQPTFWMKDMRFDLDMVWLQDWQVVEISAQVPHPEPGTPLSELPLIKPQAPANMVLEIEAGRAQTWGITVGDQLVPPPGK